MDARATRLWALGTAIAVLFFSGIAALVVKATVPPASRGRARAQAGGEAPAPSDWDPRVAPLVSFVARERGLAFAHPVAVEFLAPDRYAQLTAGDDSPTAEDRKQAEQWARLFRATGLASGPVDLARSQAALANEGTLAYYSSKKKTVYVRGTDMTVGLRVTLVHELTHVLQDQHFDLSRIEDLKTDGEQLGMRAVAEGDADRIENAYVDQLGRAEKEAYRAERRRDADGPGRPALAEVPPALSSLFAAPYELGDGFVTLLKEARGAAGVDHALQTPPTSDENILDPLTYLAGDHPKKVASPELRPGEKRFDDGDFGAVTWLMMLGARVDPHVSLRAVDGWGGDAYVAFERGDAACLRAAFAGDTPGDTAEMASALDSWAAGMPAATASVTRQADTVEFEACDPGEATKLTFAPGYDDILVLPAWRTAITEHYMSTGASPGEARCVAQKVVDGATIQQLAGSEPALFATPEFQRQLRADEASCAKRS